MSAGQPGVRDAAQSVARSPWPKSWPFPGTGVESPVPRPAEPCGARPSEPQGCLLRLLHLDVSGGCRPGHPGPACASVAVGAVSAHRRASGRATEVGAQPWPGGAFDICRHASTRSL